MLHKAFVYRLYPTPAQETALLRTLFLCRDVYNSMVHWRKHDYEVLQESPNYYRQAITLPLWKKAHPELRVVHSQTLQDVVRRVDRAFQAFFRRVQKGETPGYPRLKGVGQYDSFTFTQGGYRIADETLTLSKIGAIKIVLHRPIQGDIKTLTIRKRGDKWFACFACEVVPEPLPESAESIGIDVGLSHFATLSEGATVANPRFFRTDEKALAKSQRRFEKVKNKHRSRQRQKAKKVVSRIHERIRNRRHNFVHQFARKLVNQYQVIAVEKLQVENMSKRPEPKPDADTGTYLPNGAGHKTGLNKSIWDASWSQFRTILMQKAESAARQIIEVNPAFTSQDCSSCGFRVRKTLKERVHSCPNCGLVRDRDHNAARNIIQIAVGLHSVGKSVEAPRFIAGE